ncbi:hypothetical protein FXO38_32530 [Capsicum annuum]|nr:hypothetical protein FXO38_32530 [Capsicum annuum]KAF3627103.1 hypothetical protein FXO37_30040 [Capsicum annuum]
MTPVSSKSQLQIFFEEESSVLRHQGNPLVIFVHLKDSDFILVDNGESARIFVCGFPMLCSHLLIRQVNYFPYNGKEHQYRVFPWTTGFNQEIMKAVVWISLPDLSPDLLTLKSLISIASAVGKPIAIDKATQHQGHDEDVCRLILKRIQISSQDEAVHDQDEKLHNVPQGSVSGQQTSVEVDDEQAMIDAAQVEQNGQQLTCKQPGDGILKGDGNFSTQAGHSKDVIPNSNSSRLKEKKDGYELVQLIANFRSTENVAGNYDASMSWSNASGLGKGLEMDNEKGWTAVSYKKNVVTRMGSPGHNKVQRSCRSNVSKDLLSTNSYDVLMNKEGIGAANIEDDLQAKEMHLMVVNDSHKPSTVNLSQLEFKFWIT